MKDGIGKMEWNDGRKYNGSWKEGLFHGLGTLTAGEFSYEGSWKYGKPEGHGIYKWNDGRSYEGYYLNGKK